MIKNESPIYGRIAAALLAGTLAVFAGIAIYEGFRPEVDPYARRECPSSQEAYTAAQGIVKESLSYPLTAKFPILSNDEITAITMSCIYVIDSYVDSRNGFNVPVRANYKIRMTKELGPSAWSVQSLEIN